MKRHFLSSSAFRFRSLLVAPLVAIAVLLGHPAFAQDTSTGTPGKDGPFRVAGLLGLDFLNGDPGSSNTTGFAMALSANVKLADLWALDLRYLLSSHGDVDHSALTLGADYYFGEFETFSPYFSFGLSIDHNAFRNYDRKGDSLGGYIGAGAEWVIFPHVRLGPEIRYTKTAGARTRIGSAFGDREITSVADDFSVMARILYSIPTD